ncbi:MAG: inner membrane CreD family protein, partial [Treponema sp.]|nr:inner membrane CreD family protein [Treponema sp.]
CGAAILVSAYLSSVTKQLKIGLGMIGSFIILYVYLFFSLKSEDYAFLIGAVFIFIILALVMFFTRNVDWSSLGKKKESLLPDPAQS